MARFVATVKRLLVGEEGATAVEYGLMIGLIAAVVIAGARALGVNTEAVFEAVAASIASA